MAWNINLMRLFGKWPGWSAAQSGFLAHNHAIGLFPGTQQPRISLRFVFGAAARAPMAAITLAAGLALRSTVSRPTINVPIEHAGWRGAYLVSAGLFAPIATPLHAFALPRWHADAPPWHRRAGRCPCRGLVLGSLARA